MKFLKKNIKIIIAFIVGAIIASSITAYAAINATAVKYTDEQTVSEAITDLYDKIQKASDRDFTCVIRVYVAVRYGASGADNYNSTEANGYKNVTITRSNGTVTISPNDYQFIAGVRSGWPQSTYSVGCAITGISLISFTWN